MRRLLVVLFLLAACAGSSPEANNAARTAELRRTYPPGRTTRTDVMMRFGRAPDVTRVRPSIGWSEPFIRDVEDRTSTLVFRADQWISPATTSAGVTLAHVWFFFDRADVLVDVVLDRLSD